MRWAACIVRRSALPARSRQRPAIAHAVRDRLRPNCSPPTLASSPQATPSFRLPLTDARLRWDAAMAPFKGTTIVTYRCSWPNLVEHFGLIVMGYVEPKPGIPPTPRTRCVHPGHEGPGMMVILVEPYFRARRRRRHRR